MTDPRFVAPLKEGGTPSVSPEIGRTDPPAIRARLMLETCSHMMTEFDWPYRETTIDLRCQGDEIGAFRLFGANKPDSIEQVYDRKIDISILNPGAILSMAHKGVGLFSKPMEVAIIAVMPHHDQLGFAVTERSGLKSLDDIKAKRYPLRLSVRGTMDSCTTRLVEQVLKAHGFGYEDILSWGGSVSYDQPMPAQSAGGRPTRLQRVSAGELDAVFEEGVIVWANQALATGMRLLPITEARLAELEIQGFTRGKLETSRFDRLGEDVATVDFSGWPIYCRVDTPDLLVRKFCEALDAKRDTIPWNWGPVKQKDLPLERMLVDAPDTPIDVPFHRVAREFWAEKGYLKA